MSGYSVNEVKDRRTLDQALAVRRRVFIDEQNVPENLEIDEFDSEESPVRHFIVTDDSGKSLAAARLRPYDESTGKIERVAVLAEYRGKGLGRIIMEKLEEAAQQDELQQVKLNAQLTARKFYETLGYTAEGGIFMDAGIEHIAMKKKL